MVLAFQLLLFHANYQTSVRELLNQFAQDNDTSPDPLMMQSGFVSNIFLSSFLSEEKLFFWQRQDWLFSRRYELWWVPINRFGPWFHPSILFPAHQSAEEGEGDQGSSPLPSWTATTLTSASPGAAQPRPRTSMTVPRRTRLTLSGSVALVGG